MSRREPAERAAAGEERAEPGGEAELAQLVELATGVAHRAAELLLARLPAIAGRARLRSGASAKSSPTDLVTEVDHASEALIVELLLGARPDDGILGEEGTSRRGSSGLTWVIDPLDGTTNYLYGIPAFAVSIAAQRGGKSVVGVVNDPLRRETFAAAEGQGATRNGTPLRLDEAPQLAEALVGTGFSYLAPLRAAQARLLATVLPEVRDIRRAGSAALDLCSVAAGRLDAYFEAGLGPWDLAAGQLIATEAGATVRAVDGLVPDRPTVVAAAPGLEGSLVELLLRAAG